VCRSIKSLRTPELASEAEVRAAALQFVRKVSNFRVPSKRNAEPFETAVDEIAAATARLLQAVGQPDRQSA
jgi:hypothetical protein